MTRDVACQVSCTYPDSNVGSALSLNSNAERRNTRLVFRFERSCGTLLGADHKELGVSKLVVVYDAKGIPDQKRSDLDANGIADGQED